MPEPPDMESTTGDDRELRIWLDLLPPDPGPALTVGMGAGTDSWERALDAAARERGYARIEHADCLVRPEVGGYRAVLLRDVLARHPDPLALLRQAREVLADEGRLMLDIPNHRYWRVSGQLLEGDWAGAPEHLQVFTRRRAEVLLDAAGFEVEQEVGLRGDGFDLWLEGGKRGQVRGGRWEIGNLTESEAIEFFVERWILSARPVRRDWGLTSIVVPCWNGREDTEACLTSIERHTQEPYELIVVDNGSTDGTEDWAAARGATVIRNAENLGFPRACNQGIEAARGRQVLLLNNDTVVTPGWLRRLLEALYSAPDVGAVGPRSNAVSGAQGMAQHYGSLQELDGWAWAWGMKRRGERFPVGRLVAFCLLLRAEALEEVGNLDERFGLGNYEDDDLCRRLERAGWRLLVANDAYVHHVGGATFRREGVDLAELLTINRRLFEEKWRHG